MDEQRFRALFEEEFDAIWRYTRRRCGSGQDADDVTAETFAAAWRRRDDVPSGDQARLWLFGTARRVLANHRRGNERRERLGHRLSSLPDGVSPDPADELLARQHDLHLALNSMPLEDRDLLMMRAWDELSVTDISQLLSCTPNAVSIRLTRARSQLRSRLDASKDPGTERTRTDRTPISEGEEA